MRQFYNLFSNEKVSTMSTQLTWTHYTELLPMKDESKLIYYLTLAINQHIGVRNLREKIKSKEYERLPKDTKNNLINGQQLKVTNLKKEHIGQIEVYMNYIDNNSKRIDKMR